jgi:hypothetical protein
MDVDAALAEVPVNLLPLLDSTDFVTREVAIAYDAAGMDLVWNFVTCAGAMTQTAVTPTTGGAHDWNHQGDGIYSLEIPASGGTINNDTEGFGWFTGVVTGVLPWRGPVIGFRAAGLNDLLIESAYSATRGLTGTALPAAAADAAGGLPISDAGGLDLDTFLGRLTGNVALASVLGALTDAAVDGDPTTTDTVMQYVKQVINTLCGAAGIPTFPAAAAPGNAVSLAEAIRAIHTNIGTPADLGGGATVAQNLSDIEGQTDDIGAAGAGLTALATAAELAKVPKSDSNVVWNATAAAQLQTEATDALNAYDPPTRAELTTDVNSILAYLDGLVIAKGTIGATGNDTTHLHLAGLTYGNDEINNYLLAVRDVSASEWHARYIEDWADAGDLATVATLPFTPENSVDLYVILAFRQDVTGGAGLDAAGVRTAIGLASANLDTQLSTIDDFLDTEITDIRNRLPAALVSGRIDASVGAMAADVVTAAAIATDAIGANELAAGAVTEIQSGLATAASIAALNNLSAAQVNAEVDTALADYDAPTSAELVSEINSVQADIATVAAFVDTEVAAIKLKTDLIPASPAAVGSAMTLTSGERDAVAAALLDLAAGVETSWTVRQLLRVMGAMLGGEISGAATSTVLVRNLGDSKTRITWTADEDGNRSAVTFDLT